MKTCFTCGQEKSPDSFHINRRNRGGLAGSCKICKILVAKQWAENNKSRIKVAAEKRKVSGKTAEYYSSPHVRERLRNFCNSPEQKAKRAARQMKRENRKRGATPPWLTSSQLQELESFYLHAKVLERETGILHHVDHIVPLQGRSVCGLHVPWNLQVIPATQNLRKSNKFEE